MSVINNKESSFFSSSSPSSSSVPSISLLGGAVFNDYKSLQNGAKGVFRRLYLAVYNWLYPQSKLDSFHLFYSLPYVLRDYDLSVHNFLYMLRLYFYTGGGVRTIDSRTFYTGRVERRFITNLIRLGFMSRSCVNPSAPHLVKNRAIQRVFITFTVDGVKFYNKVLNECYNYAKQDLFKLTQDK